ASPALVLLAREAQEAPPDRQASEGPEDSRRSGAGPKRRGRRHGPSRRRASLERGRLPAEERSWCRLRCPNEEFAAVHHTGARTASTMAALSSRRWKSSPTSGSLIPPYL